MEKAEILELTVNYIKAIKGHTNPGELQVNTYFFIPTHC